MLPSDRRDFDEFGQKTKGLQRALAAAISTGLTTHLAAPA
jgi:hypothetical protein